VEAPFARDGLVPEERLDVMAGRVARAVLGPPIRDLATTRLGTLSYAVLRHLRPRVVDTPVIATLKRRTWSRGRYPSRHGRGVGLLRPRADPPHGVSSANLDDINEVFGRMERGQIDGRIVIDYRKG